MAENAQVSTSYISKIETADTKLSLQVIIDIANALQTSVDALLADNVTYPPVYLKKDFEPLLDNMTPNELMIVRETVKALRQALLSQRQKD